MLSPEVLVVGAGAAGAAAALALAGRGLAVMLVDVRTSRARLFRAEKVEPNQIDAIARLGALPGLERAGVPIADVVDARDGRVLSRIRRRQIGLRYEGIAAVLAAALPSSVVRTTARVARIETEDAGATVHLGDGGSIRARLVVLATGASTGLAASLGIHQAPVAGYRSTTFGFDVRRSDGAPFPHAALTVYPHGPSSRAGYVSFFSVPGATRVNLFTYLEGERARAARKDPIGTLRASFPGLERLTGLLEVAGDVGMAPIELAVASDPARPSLVLVGDAFQTVCPSTGTGLEKSLSDAEALAAHVPGWLRAETIPASRVQRFYDDPAKRRVDRASIDAALYRRRVTLDDTWRMRVHRARTYAAMRWSEWPSGRAAEVAAALAAWLTSSGTG